MPRWPKRKLRPHVDEYGRSPLWYQAAAGDVDAVRRELQGGADPDAGDDVNYGALHVAVQEGHVAVATLLLKAGADPNKLDKHGNGPLSVALVQGDNASQLPLIKLLLRAGANPHQKNHYGLSPFEVATEIGHGLEVPFARGRKPR